MVWVGVMGQGNDGSRGATVGSIGLTGSSASREIPEWLIAGVPRILHFMRRDEAISTLRSHLPTMWRDYCVGRLALLGCTARDEAQDDSDIDMLVDFEMGPTFDSFMGLKLFLEDHLGGGWTSYRGRAEGAHARCGGG